MKLNVRLILGFLLVALLISGTSIVGNQLTKANIIEIVERENPKVQAVLEMEIYAKEAASSVFRYLDNNNPQEKEAFINATYDFERFHLVLHEKVRPEEEGQLEESLHPLIETYFKLGPEIMDQSDQITDGLTQMRSNIEKIDTLFDEKLQPTIDENSPQAFGKLKAALGMRVSVVETFATVESYFLTVHIPLQQQEQQEQQLRDAIKESEENFERFEKEYRSFQLSPQEKEWVNAINHNFLDTKKQADEVITLEDKKQELIKKFEEDGMKIDHILNKRLQVMALEFIQEDVKRALTTTTIMFAAILTVLILAVVFGLFLSYSITKPITGLTKSNVAISKGKYKKAQQYQLQKHQRHLPTEIAELINARELMLTKLLQNEEELKKSKKQLKKNLTELEKSKKEIEKGSRGKEQQRIATLSILRDVGYAKRELEKSYKELKKSEAANKQIFLHTSHELKTPITPIMAQAELLRGEELGKLSKEQKKSIDLIIRNMELLNHLISDILEVSRIQAKTVKLKISKASLKKITNNEVAKFRPLAKKKGVQIINKVPELSVFCDALRIRQIFTNLLDNALKFTQKGTITLTAQKEKGAVVISVNDTGVGMDKEDLAKVFSPFYQIKPSYKLHAKGTGLGLSICRSFIQQHGGKIWVESKKGKGSTFHFTLPVKKQIQKI